MNFEISTRAEIHYNSKENMEGFVSLVNMFLRTMHMTSKHPCLINVDNIDSSNDQIFYHSTLSFKDTFTALMANKIQNLKTITVRTSFGQILEKENLPKELPKVANRLCGAAFSYVGLRDSITVWKKTKFTNLINVYYLNLHKISVKFLRFVDLPDVNGALSFIH